MNLGAEKNFLSIENGQKKFAKSMANDDFSEPARRADSKNPIFIFFANFWARVTPGALGVVLVGFWEARQLSPFLGRGSV